MASKNEIEQRRKDLYGFMLRNRYGLVKFNHIINFYKTFKDPNNGKLIYKDLSEDTIRKDLDSIDARCIKTNNTYVLKSNEEIENLTISIKNILSKCIVSKPMLYTKSLVEDFTDDINKDLSISSIIVYSEKKDKNIIFNFYMQLKQLFDFYKDSTDIDPLNIQLFDYHIEFTFINDTNLKNFYNEILKIQTSKTN